MRVEREVEIARPIEEVFAFVSEPLNDPNWCRKVRSVERIGDGHYAVIHRPVPLRPARRMDLRVVDVDPLRSVEISEDDGTDVFRVRYELERTRAGGTRIRQRSEARVGAVPRILHWLWRRGIERDIARQLSDLKKRLESR